MIDRRSVRRAGRPLLLVPLILIVPPVAAAAGADVDRRLAECAALSVPSDRLACFESVAADRAAAQAGVDAPEPPLPAQALPRSEAAPATPPGTPSPAAPPPSRVEAAPGDDPEASFGAEMLERPDDEADARRAEQISAEIARVEQRTYGERVFYLSNGQVWEELEAGRGRYRSGQKVTIRRALLGSYMLEADGVRASRVRRIR